MNLDDALDRMRALVSLAEEESEILKQERDTARAAFEYMCQMQAAESGESWQAIYTAVLLEVNKLKHRNWLKDS